jgi:hypothetical protein
MSKMSSAKRQKNDEEVAQKDGLQTSMELRFAAIIESSAFPHIEALQHILLRYLIYKAFEPPRGRSANTLEDAQYMWESYVAWCEDMGRPEIVYICRLPYVYYSIQ